VRPTPRARHFDHQQTLIRPLRLLGDHDGCIPAHLVGCQVLWHGRTVHVIRWTCRHVSQMSCPGHEIALFAVWQPLPHRIEHGVGLKLRVDHGVAHVHPDSQ
jgi:hypothetical protein